MKTTPLRRWWQVDTLIPCFCNNVGESICKKNGLRTFNLILGHETCGNLWRLRMKAQLFWYYYYRLHTPYFLQFTPVISKIGQNHLFEKRLVSGFCEKTEVLFCLLMPKVHNIGRDGTSAFCISWDILFQFRTGLGDHIVWPWRSYTDISKFPRFRNAAPCRRSSFASLKRHSIFLQKLLKSISQKATFELYH